MTRRLRSPIRWFGGKGRMVAKILPLLPPHRHYVEPFGGGASILLAKPPCAGVETYNDVDEGLANFFRVLANPELFAKFYRRVEALPWGRAIYEECCETWENKADLVERVARWFVVARQSFAGCFGAGWGSAVATARKGMAHTSSAWLSALDLLPEIHSRLRRVQVECADWRVVLERYCGPGYLAYIDPPYVQTARSDERYRHELTFDDHEELVEALLAYDGAVVLSGYDCPSYRRFDEAGWDKHEIKTVCHAAGKTRGTGILGEGSARRMQPRTEVVWVKPFVSDQLPGL
jgi:DNA adenine methylase